MVLHRLRRAFSKRLDRIPIRNSEFLLLQSLLCFPQVKGHLCHLLKTCSRRRALHIQTKAVLAFFLCKLYILWQCWSLLLFYGRTILTPSFTRRTLAMHLQSTCQAICAAITVFLLWHGAIQLHLPTFLRLPLLLLSRRPTVPMLCVRKANRKPQTLPSKL